MSFPVLVRLSYMPVERQANKRTACSAWTHNEEFELKEQRNLLEQYANAKAKLNNEHLKELTALKKFMLEMSRSKQRVNG